MAWIGSGLDGAQEAVKAVMKVLRFDQPQGVGYVGGGVALGEEDEGLVGRWRVVHEVEAGVCRPNVDRVFGLDDIAAAHRYMENNEAAGKVVVRFNRAP